MKISNIVMGIGALMIAAELLFDRQFSGGGDNSIENNKIMLVGAGAIGAGFYLMKKGK